MAVDIVDCIYRVRRGAPLPPVPDTDRLALRYALEMAAAIDKRIMERSSMHSLTEEGVERLLAQAEILRRQ